ncbi:cell wall protein [Enterococcus avium]|nr:cell wall protein [Enterococcus avium]
MMRKRGLFFLVWIVVLLFSAQSFINGMTAIALTEDKEKNEQQLFDNEYGKASIQYQIKENHVDWQINIHKNDNKGPTRLTYSLQDVKDKAVILPTTVKDDQSSENLFEVKTDKSIADYGQVVEKEVSTAIKNDQIKFTTPVVSEVNLKISLNTKTGDKAEEVGFSKEYPITLVKANVTESTTIQSSLGSSTVGSTATSSSEATKESTSGDVTNLGDADEATVDSAKKEAEKKYEETGRPQVITRSAADSVALAGKTYTDIIPEYTSNEKGTYPTNFWQPDEKSNVINHQGNVGGESSWDGITSWDGNQNNKKNSYIEYGGTGADADFAIRKYAKESTQSEGLYDVFLNIRGNVQKEITPIDIMLVVDWSGSMNDNNRIGEVKKGIDQFVNTLAASGISDKINIGYVGYSSPGYLNDTINLMPFKDAQQRIKTFTPNKASGGTFTEKALRDAQNQLSNGAKDHKKVIVLLTDGVPTFSYKPSSVKSIANAPKTLTEGESYYADDSENTIIGQGNSSSLNGYYTYSPENGNRGNYVKNYPTAKYSENSTYVRVPNAFVATIGQAVKIKEAGTEIHSLGIQLNSDKNADLTSEQVQNRMKQIATKSDSGVLYYETANKASGIANYFSNKAVQIIGTVSGGKVIDPIGKQFNYVTNSLEVTSVAGSALIPNYTEPEKNGEIDINNLNLGKGQEIQIHYQVRINTEDENFVPDKWYQINGRTTFTPNQELPDSIVDFGVPSAKAPGTTIDLTKEWDEFDSNILGRSDLLFQVSRNEVPIGVLRITSQNEKLDDKNIWSRIGVQKISAADSPYSETIWLPKFDNQGNDFKYAISKELTELTNYESAKINDNTWKNTKIFTPLSLKITKKDSITGSLLKGAEFAISGGDLSESTLLESIGDGTYVLPKNITLNKGKVYEVRETKSPDGYRMLNDPIRIEIDATGKVSISNKELSNANLTVSDNVITFDVPNKPKVPLPSTGGSGTWMYYLAGSLALVVVGGYLFYRSRNSKGVA